MPTIYDPRQLTIGEAIQQLESAIQESDQIRPLAVFGFCGMAPCALSSYRGYYDHLAIEYAMDEQCSAQVLLEKLRAALQPGNTFDGYKGGEYQMHANTPLWVDKWGQCTGTAVTGIRRQGQYIVLDTTLID